MSQHLKEDPPPFGPEGAKIDEDHKYGYLFSWSVALHNKVNVRTNKREWTEDEAMAKLKHAFQDPHTQLDIAFSDDMRKVHTQQIEWLQEQCREKGLNASVPQIPGGESLYVPGEKGGELPRAQVVLMEDLYAIRMLRTRLSQAGVDVRQLEQDRNKSLMHAQQFLKDREATLKAMDEQIQKKREQVHQYDNRMKQKPVAAGEKPSDPKSEEGFPIWIWIIGGASVLVFILLLILILIS